MREDLAQMYRRLVFNVLAGNRDDHLRNHGFLRSPACWRLAPAFDLNPAREMRTHATSVGGKDIDIDIDMDDLRDLRSHFGLADKAARGVIGEVIDAVHAWREVANETGVSRAEQNRVAPVSTSRLSPAWRTFCRSCSPRLPEGASSSPRNITKRASPAA